MNDLAALLGGGAAPAAPLPSGPLPGPDPLAELLGGGAPMDPSMGGMPMDPMAMGAAPAPGFASTDPAFVQSVLEQMLMARNADHAALDAQATATLMSDPLFEALTSGAPVGPGAGQDAQAIGMPGDIAPEMVMP
jgi:hypothetical protein